MALTKENMAEQEENYFIFLSTELIKTKWLEFLNQACGTFEERFFKRFFSLKEKIWKNLPNGFKLLKFWEPVLFQGHRIKSGKPNYLL